ncbi:MAG: SAM-dependent DNA methyltransferase, partial [Acidimicrobiia bacterium]|nr:SAM-dependent DNA methyltransferase [Acidimicrobiia bacterium]
MTERAPGRQRALGIHYTPASAADTLARLVLAGRDAAHPDRPLTVVDPACGAGSLLAAVARRHHGPVTLWGADVDAAAVAATGALAGSAAVHVQQADGLLAGRAEYPGLPQEGVDVVVANPPFLGQVRGVTVHDRQRAAALRDRFGPAAHRYCDPAALFLLAAVDLLRPGGRLGIIVPVSLLSSGDARRARDEVVARAHMVDLWLPDTPIFEAAVEVAVVVFERRGPSEVGEVPPLRRWVGPEAPPPPRAPAGTRPTGGARVSVAVGVA